MKLEIIDTNFLLQFKKLIVGNPIAILNENNKKNTPVDYFKFYNSVSSVYSSKIEGVEIDYDSFFKYKFMNIEYLPDYTKKADDLYNAYEFILENELNFENLLKAHTIVSNHLLPKKQRGVLRNNPMFIMNSQDRIEYVATNQFNLKVELEKLFRDISKLLKANLEPLDIFYFAAFIHLVFVKIHPYNDGNGRTARLLEKWFLVSKLGKIGNAVQLEKNYYLNLSQYYFNLKQLGLEYENLNYSKSIPFLLMTVNGIQ